MAAFQIQELPESLVVIQPRRDGCAAGFLLLWLTGWTSVLVKIAAAPWSSTSLNALVLMGLAELLVLGILLYSLTGRKRLTIGPREITYEDSAIVTFDRCPIRIENIRSVDLLPLDPTKRKDHAVGVLVVTGGDSEIRFGEGLSDLELHGLLARIRRKLDEQRAEVAPVVSAINVAPISHARRAKQDSKVSKSLPMRIAPWLTVSLFVAVGVAFLFAGWKAITTGRPFNVLFGILFLCVGLFLAAGLTLASLAVFVDRLRRRRRDLAVAPADVGEAELAGPRSLFSTALPHVPMRARRNSEGRIWSWKAPLESLLFAPAIVIALVIRFRSLPWDDGGCFFQVWHSLVGLAILALLPRLKRLPRILAAFVLVPDLFFLLYASLRFAPQAMLPFDLLAGVTVGACYLWSRSKPRLAVLVALALIPISADLYFYGIAHMRTIDRLRDLSPHEIQEVLIEDASQGKKVVIRDHESVTRIAECLGDTSPYSPNHEGISQPRQVTICFTDSSVLRFRVGKGNLTHPETAWIEFGVEVYQNPSLYFILQSHNVFL